MVEVELGTHRCIPSILYLRGRAEYRRKTGGEQAGCQRNLGDPSASRAIPITYIILTTAVYSNRPVMAALHCGGMSGW